MAKQKPKLRADTAKHRPVLPTPTVLQKVEKAAPAPAAPEPENKAITIGKAALGAGLLLIPVFIYYRTVYNNAVNVPFEDDFDSALKFLSSYLFKTNSLVDRVKLIFSQHNEHRIVFDRLVFLLDYYLTGFLNFRHLILVGNLSLVFLAYLLFRSSFPGMRLADKLLYFVPVAFGLFQLHFWELTVWGMASLQNLYVVVFALLGFYALSQTPKKANWFVVACVAGVAAAFTSGNGMFTFLVGIPVLLVLKQYKKLAIWTSLTVVTFALYFWGYAKPGHHPDIYDSLVNNTSRAFDYFFTLSGSVFSARPEHPARAGKFFLVLFLGLFGWQFFRKTATRNPTIPALLLFTYVTCLSLMATRSGFGVVQAFSPRYGILSVVLFIGLYVMSLEAVTQRYIRPLVGAVFLFLSVYLFRNSQQQGLLKVEDRTRLLQLTSAFYNDNKDNLILYWSDAKQAKVIFEDALKKKIYQLPPITFDQIRSLPQTTDAQNLAATNDIVSEAKPYATHDYLVFFQSWAVLNGTPSERVTTQVIAQSGAQSYAFETAKHVRYDVVNQLQSLQFLGAGFSCVIKKTDLKPGHYTLWLHLTNGRTQSYQPLNLTFDV
ncbi:hypothetical protein [Larkinella rosea]|uniref:Glycosyltransferase RgtA/B/C/D-like domain-containing protein n=1 Tax=Larkinella rosea TaxID=2025312 RepID=A0A3P1BC37_9BACT|nr:hypothetical protein [Larkinella rosea]RRA98716.1 hypothetical protein EHT25_27365 [Larkinella rosea]